MLHSVINQIAWKLFAVVVYNVGDVIWPTNNTFDVIIRLTVLTIWRLSKCVTLVSWEAFSSDHKTEKHLKGSLILWLHYGVCVTMAVLCVISKIEAFAIQTTWIAEFYI